MQEFFAVLAGLASEYPLVVTIATVLVLLHPLASFIVAKTETPKDDRIYGKFYRWVIEPLAMAVGKAKQGRPNQKREHVPKAKVKAHPVAIIAAVGLSLLLVGCANSPVANVGERPDVVNIGDGKIFGREASGFFGDIINASAADARRAQARAQAFGDTVAANCWDAVADASEKAKEASAGVDSSEIGPLEKYQVARNIRIMVTDSSSPVGVWCRAMIRDSVGVGAGLAGKVFGL